MIWKILWLLFAICIIGYAIWSLLEVLKQKRAWRAFAKKYDFNYLEKNFFSPPGFWGAIKDKKVVAYINVLQANDKKKSGSWTFVDVIFDSAFEDRIMAVGSEQLFDELLGSREGLDFFVPTDLGWSDKQPIFTNDADFFRSYLNRGNVAAIEALKKLPGGGYNFLMQPEGIMISYYTRKPIDSPKEMNLVVKTLLDAATAWESKADISKIAKEVSTSGLSFEDDSVDVNADMDVEDKSE